MGQQWGHVSEHISGCERTKTITAQWLRRSQQLHMHESEAIRGNCGNVLANKGSANIMYTVYLFPSEDSSASPLPPPRWINNCRTPSNSHCFISQQARLWTASSHPSSGGRGIYMSDNTERRRYGTCALVLALFHSGGSGSLTICLGLQTLMCQGMIKHIQMPAFAQASPVSH